MGDDTLNSVFWKIKGLTDVGPFSVGIWKKNESGRVHANNTNRKAL